MKILIAGTSYFPEFSAGTEVYMRLMAMHLSLLGDSVVIACGGKAAVPDAGVKWGLRRFSFEGVPVIRMARHPDLGAVEDPYLLGDEERHQLWLEILDSELPDVVFTIGPGPALMGDVELIAHSRGVPVISTLIHPGQVCPRGSRINQFDKGCMAPMEERLCGNCAVASKSSIPGLYRGARLLGSLGISGAGRLATLVRLPGLVDGFIARWQKVRDAVSLFVAHSDAAYELLVANGVPKAKIIFSTPGFEIRACLSRQDRTTRAKVRFGFVGRLCKEKGVITLLRAWESLDRAFAAELHLWGDPASGDAAVVRQITELAANDERVFFNGPFGRDETDRVYQSMDVLVVPSEWFDNCPFVIWEAFTAGIPVIGSDFGGISTMIKDHVNGLLFPMGDASALAGAIKKLSNNEFLKLLTDQVELPRDVREHVAEMREVFMRISSDPDGFLASVHLQKKS
jgi:glycosyltransferase involved in cell wall biosynthesis